MTRQDLKLRIWGETLLLAVVFVSLIFVVLAGTVLAQGGPRGAITGNLKDPDGAVVPHASVTIVTARGIASWISGDNESPCSNNFPVTEITYPTGLFPYSALTIWINAAGVR